MYTCESKQKPSSHTLLHLATHTSTLHEQCRCVLGVGNIAFSQYQIETIY